MHKRRPHKIAKKLTHSPLVRTDSTPSLLIRADTS